MNKLRWKINKQNFQKQFRILERLKKNLQNESFKRKTNKLKKTVLTQLKWSLI